MGRFGEAPLHQPIQFLTSRPNPSHELLWHFAMCLPVDLASQSRSLQSASAQVEGEGRQRIKLAIGQGYIDQAQDSAFRCMDISAQQVLGLCLRDALLVSLRFPH